MRTRILFFRCLLVVLLASCGTVGPGLFVKRSPHDQYGQHITDAGLRETALGRLWFHAAEQSLAEPLLVSLPYSETGYFAAERPQAVGLQFKAVRGQKIRIQLSKKPSSAFSVYLDLWEAATGGSRSRLLAAADTTGTNLEYEVKTEGSYIVRLQPELLKSGEYTLTINTGPSLAFPLPKGVKYHIGSFWGAGRDKGARRHEGVDIFGSFRTPVVAAANGVVTRVGENTLGGKVVFLTPEGEDFTLYYAHLDSQLVRSGTPVHIGDTLGLMGNTGNARTTPTHLHFGIYTNSGAVDPLPFINPQVTSPQNITASLVNLGKNVRSGNQRTKLYGQPDSRSASSLSMESHTLLRVEAASAGWYRVVLPEGQRGYVSATTINDLAAPLRPFIPGMQVALLDEPDSMANRKKTLSPGEALGILANYKGFYYVSDNNKEEGWISIDKAGVNGKASAAR